jgi:hypothetical protein
MWQLLAEDLVHVLGVSLDERTVLDEVHQCHSFILTLTSPWLRVVNPLLGPLPALCNQLWDFETWVAHQLQRTMAVRTLLLHFVLSGLLSWQLEI